MERLDIHQQLQRLREQADRRGEQIVLHMQQIEERRRRLWEQMDQLAQASGPAATEERQALRGPEAHAAD